MKTIVRKESNLSIWIFADTKFVEVQSNQTIVGDPVDFYISDCTLEDCDLITNVSPPIDWAGHKYFFVDGVWTKNPDYVEPIIPPLEEVIIEE